MPKLTVNFGNPISKDSHKNQYPNPICNFGFTAPQYSDKCWLNLPKCLIFLIGNTHRSFSITCAITWLMLRLVCLEPVTTCRCGSILNWCHHCTSIVWWRKSSKLLCNSQRDLNQQFNACPLCVFYTIAMFILHESLHSKLAWLIHHLTF